MKISDVKHNHSLTDLLKILLFTILMLAPVGMVATRCLYVIVNKNANKSYSDNWIQSTTQLNNSSQNMVGATYNVYYQYYDNTSNQYSNYVKYSDISIDWTTFGASDEYNYNGFRFAYDQIQLTTGDDNTNVQTIANVWGNTLKEFTFIYESGSLVYGNNAGTGHSNVYIINYKQDKLDNVFEYSISKLEQSNLFNWTENTAIFSGIDAMNTQLGINSPAIGIILTYWLILTCIYVIIDIVLKLFTILTHAIGRKT